MGLDQYLIAKKWTPADPALHAMLTALTESIRFKSEVSHITVEAMYWRKANHIHRWFVENVQKGVDDCRTYYVTRETLRDLKVLAERCLENRDEAVDLLPTQSGCFFGGTEIGEWYWAQLEYTRDRLDEILQQADPSWEFYYDSSW